MIKKYIVMALLISVLLIFSGCVISGYGSGGHVSQHRTVSYEKQSPPPWAPAHGHRAKYQYRYYPSNSIYFDTGRGLYFYYRDGSWTASVSIPVGININFSDFVAIEMDTEKPYIHHDEVQKRYPPGQTKKRDNGKGNKGKKDKDKHKWK